MKKITALALALMLACSLMLPALAEDNLFGDWYGSFAGATLIMTLKEDGTYSSSLNGTPMGEGVWLVEDGIVYTDEDKSESGAFRIDGEALVSDVMGVTMTRTAQEADSIEIAPAAEGVPAEAYAGEWLAAYIAIDGTTLQMTAIEEMMGESMSILSALMDIDFSGLEMTYTDGALLFSTSVLEQTFSVSAQLLQDGMLALTISLSETPFLTLYFTPAA